MIYLKKILIDNNISVNQLSKKLNRNITAIQQRLNLNLDFKIQELENIKQILVDMQIIQSDFDVGDFLNIVEN